MRFTVFLLCCEEAFLRLIFSSGALGSELKDLMPQTRAQGIKSHRHAFPSQEYVEGASSTGRHASSEFSVFAQYTGEAKRRPSFSPETLRVLNQPYPENERKHLVATLPARASTSKRSLDKVEQGLAALFPKGSTLLIKDMRANTVGRYTAGDVRNRGSFGVVMEVTDVQSNTAYAMKVMYRELSSSVEFLTVEPVLRNFLEMESESMKLLKKDGVSQSDLVTKYRLAVPLMIGEVVGVPLVSRSQQQVAYYGQVVIMPLLIADLEKLHVSPRDTTLLRYLLREIVRATAALHSLGFSHGDIKEQNMMFDQDGGIMLIDFGNLHAFGSQVPCDDQIISPDYIPPELAQACLVPNHPYIIGDKHDSWSAGVTLFLFACSRRRELPYSLSQAFEKAGSHREVFQILSDLSNRRWTTERCIPTADPVVLEVAQTLLQPDPQNRPSVRDLVDGFPFFQSPEPSPESLQPPAAPVQVSRLPPTASPFSKAAGRGEAWTPQGLYRPVPAPGPRGQGAPLFVRQPQPRLPSVPQAAGHGWYPQLMYQRRVHAPPPGTLGDLWARQPPSKPFIPVPRVTSRDLGGHPPTLGRRFVAPLTPTVRGLIRNQAAVTGTYPALRTRGPHH